MRLGVIADDFTGATDIAGFLVANGLRTVQLNGVPPADLQVDVDAVVISLKTRSCPVEEAVSQSLASLDWLRARGCPQFFFKYCSTFDSTPKGNIGPVTDALLEALGEDFTVICPVLPVNGRTIYNGYLFVNGVPLDESGMRHHPVTPMTDANLMRLMDAQSQGKTGNVPSTVMDQGPDAVRAALAALKAKGFRYAVLDALNDAHLVVMGQAVADMKLVTGGSGLADGMARAWAGTGDAAAAAAEGRPARGRAVVLSGSCSQMTNAQVAAYRQSAPALAVSVERCLSDAEGYAEELAAWVLAQPKDGLAPLVYATTEPAKLKELQERFGAAEASEAVERLFGALAKQLEAAGFDQFIVAGGETSGIVTQSLGIGGFHIGPQIAPGVPWVRAVGKPLSLALKSGNFGQERFFFEAQDLAA
ncbi:3-oxo-tetronate kinase [Roseomonas marmotae]|uniref:3-oxo-tetronate kinase n=1 Tax=Roseomonas marmotae TaxID=2768161 RepID=A0ABS3K882_9PROT|nr:3-oxo-tetronate kinase [Roseomonas marmotae]MBO1073681.1 four-carbon acid sugar kinase family protein [Roseomonas marmotae]QTI78677.1 four-carbon acid sugar kinase family protein [Roseomonas marmotae]